MQHIYKQADFRTVYKLLATDFCNIYYPTYDTNLNLLSTYFSPVAQVTYSGIESIGFAHIIEHLKSIRTKKITHSQIEVSSQPLSESSVIICVNGNIAYNDSIFTSKFTETIILQKDAQGSVYIISSIFKIIY